MGGRGDEEEGWRGEGGGEFLSEKRTRESVCEVTGEGWM